jgi:hypothetical protein
LAHARMIGAAPARPRLVSHCAAEIRASSRSNEPCMSRLASRTRV